MFHTHESLNDKNIMMCVHTTKSNAPKEVIACGISHDHYDLTENHGGGGHAGNFAQCRHS